MPTPALSISLFGPLRVLVGEEPLPRVPTRSVVWLLALLVLRHGRAVERSWLAGTLWPQSEERQALNNLRNDLVYLRKALGHESARLQSPTRDTLRLDLDGAAVDLIAFDQAIQAGDEGSLQRAVALYTGPLLEGCYEEWIILERESREQAVLAALETVAERATERAEHAEAIRYLRQAQTLDPLRDSVARRLMASLAATGDPGAAVEVYRELRKRLQEDLASAPDEATTQLFQQIRTHARETTRVAPRPPVSAALSSSPLPTRPPHPLTPLIGREPELADLQQRLQQSRLVTLIGAGGVGKTRLALEVVARAQQAFPGEVVWVELASLAESALILPTIAAALGLPQEGVSDLETLLGHLVAHFSEGECLLVVDNCEHLLDAVAEVVQTLLSHCPRLRVLATSRQRLGLTGEVAWRVPSLPVPASEQAPADLQAALTFPAIRLFVERAASARMGFQLTSREEVEAVCQISRRLDGIPLALELAAARINVLSVVQIAVRLDDRFTLLTGGHRTASPRHQTLRALIDWSYEQLAEPERVLLRRLSVCAGGWSLEAAEALFRLPNGLPPEAAGEVVDVLASLLDRSLVLAEAHGGALRYQMLETVREYAREKLQESGEEEAVRARHAEHYLGLAEQARPFVEKEDLAWLDRLESEHDNLRAALTFFTAQEPHIDQAVRMAVALASFWDLRAHFYEQRIFITGLAWRQTPPTLARVQLLGIASTGVIYLDRDYVGAERMLSEMLQIARQLDYQAGIAHALNALARLIGDSDVAGSEYDPVAARALSEESLAIMRELGDRNGMAHVLFLQGNLAWQAGDLDEACSRWQACRALDEEQGVKGGLVLRSLGELALERGEAAAARDCFETFLIERHKIGERWGILGGLQGLGALALAEGKADRAARLLGAGCAVRESLQSALSEQERIQEETLRSALRETLGESAYEAAWADGYAMTIEEAVQFALLEGLA
ncbi:MAG TPA: BTAD domain-containing putative transcriptional regulator [Chthonomonadaceae bacterium]|nr:BTAD domain-containing putative transcriptional regulator [Chthonomonadaceae bacterium]